MKHDPVQIFIDSAQTRSLRNFLIESYQFERPLKESEKQNLVKHLDTVIECASDYVELLKKDLNETN